MKQLNRIRSIATLFTILVLLVPAVVHAQDSLPGDPDAPVDGGLSLLVAAGIGYGARKLRKSGKGQMTNRP